MESCLEDDREDVWVGAQSESLKYSQLEMENDGALSRTFWGRFENSSKTV